VGFKSIRVAIFYAGLPKPNATLLLYPGLGPAMLRRLRRESLPVSIGGVKKILVVHLHLSCFFVTLLTDPCILVKLGRETLSFWVKAFSEDTAKRLENFGFIQSRPGGSIYP